LPRNERISFLLVPFFCFSRTPLAPGRLWEYNTGGQSERFLHIVYTNTTTGFTSARHTP